MEPTLPVAAFPPELQYSLGYAFSHTNGRISVDQLELAVKRMLELESGRVPTLGFDLKLQAKMQVLEPDVEGCVPMERMEEALAALVQPEERSSGWAAGYVLVGVVAVAMVSALLGLVVELNRDMESINGVFTDLRTGQPIQTASAEITVVRRSGVLATRGSNSEKPVITRPFWGVQNLSSSMPASELQGISVLLSAGRRIGLLTNGFVVVPKTRLSVSEKLVLFNTALGTFVLDGQRLAPAASGQYAAYADIHETVLQEPHGGARRQEVSNVHVELCYSAEECAAIGIFWDP